MAHHQIDDSSQFDATKGAAEDWVFSIVGDEIAGIESHTPGVVIRFKSGIEILCRGDYSVHSILDDGIVDESSAIDEESAWLGRVVLDVSIDAQSTLLLKFEDISAGRRELALHNWRIHFSDGRVCFALDGGGIASFPPVTS